MTLKSNSAFSMIEVLITTVILSTAIVFVFRSFSMSLAAARFSQNLTLACYLAEDKIAEIEERQKYERDALTSENGQEDIQNTEFNYAYELSASEDPRLINLNFNTSWQEGMREKEYRVAFSTALLPENK